MKHNYNYREPWAINEDQPYKLYDNEGGVIAQTALAENPDPYSYAERIKLCINVCAGIPSQTLKQIGPGQVPEFFKMVALAVGEMESQGF